MTTMTKNEIYPMVKWEMSRYWQLDGWKVDLRWYSRLLGLCSFRDRRISLSVNLVSTNSKEIVRQVLLHEIAHALTHAGHNKKFWAKFKELGEDKEMFKKNFLPFCNYEHWCGCGYHDYRFRTRRKKRICPACALKGRRVEMCWSKIKLLEPDNVM